MIKILSLFTLITSFVFGQIDSPFIVPLDETPKTILTKELAPEQIRSILNENLCEQTIFSFNTKKDGCPGCKITFRVDRQTYGPQVNILGWVPQNNGGDGYCENLNNSCFQVVGCQYNGTITLGNPQNYTLNLMSTMIMSNARYIRENSQANIPVGSSIVEYSRNCGSREEAIIFISSEYLMDQFTVIYISCSSCEDISPHY